MKALLISDLHANYEALQTILRKVRRKSLDHVFCLGDFVGYGGQPNQVLELMRSLPYRRRYVRGNHDRVAAGLGEPIGFNHVATAAALWTRDHLSSANRTFLRKLPVGPLAVDGELAICHGSPSDEDQYLFTARDIHEAFDAYPAARIIFFGHTHLPAVFRLTPEGELEGRIYREPATVKLDPHSRYLINPGSTGQPRDRNPEAAFAIFDRKRSVVQMMRASYDIGAAQRAIRKAGLPKILADRLQVGN